MTCTHCSNTGSLSKLISGPLDCTRCTTAGERVLLEHWYKTVAKPQQLAPLDEMWLAIQRDRQLHKTD